MDYRRDVFPPAIALALSAGVHLALAWWSPAPRPDTPIPAPAPVVVEYLPGEGEGDPGSETSAETTDEPREDGGRPEVRAPPEPPPLREEPQRPLAAAPERQAEPEPYDRPGEPEDPFLPEETPPPVTAEDPGEPPPLPLAHLFPRSEDLRLPTSPSPVPDPAGAEAKEATLSLQDPDARYKGYLGHVEASIDRTWRWKEAILAAQGGGRVLLRFSLAPGGAVEDVQVVESSGSPLLDWEAAEAVRRALVPPFPGHWTIERLHLFAQFVYRLD
ncbi:MAG: TonB family protein [Deferrisomatales bacterium]|nr:TonB family protein [Deferrisomatales bacterium]